MTDDRVVPTPRPSDLPTFRIIADGKEISPECNVISITVSREVNRVPFAEIIFLDGDAAGEDFKLSGEDNLLPGKKIEVHAGYHSDETVIFKGVITGQSIRARKTKPSQLIMECRDESVKMTVGRKNRNYFDTTDGEIMDEIISSYSLQKDVDRTELKHKEMVQFYSTDWDFILKRTEANGKLVCVIDGKIEIKAPDTGKEPALSLIYGSTMIEFEAGMEARWQLPSVKSISWDPSTQEIIEAEGDEPGLKEEGNVDGKTLSQVVGLDDFRLQHTGMVNSQELKTWAESKMVRSRLSKISGRVRCQGFAGVNPLDTVKLSGVGERFNGTALVTGVRHQINTGNWETDIQFGMPGGNMLKNTCGIKAAPAAGLLPAVNGLQIGVVTKLEDPDGEDRVQVRLPLLGVDEGVWARVARLDGGDRRGAFFLPEIGDEVVVGFLDDDPRYPVILGMLNSSSKPAPITAKDENNEKGFVTREDIRLLFDDKKKSVTVKTPGGHQLTLSDDEKKITIKDSGGNMIEMGSGGIKIESAKDIKIKAPGDIKVDGANIDMKSSAKFKAQGSSGAEITTSATAVLKGSLVQIN